MAVHASLRFEPVGCVVTFLGDGTMLGDGTDEQVLDVVGARSEIVLRSQSGDDHFRDLHGCVLAVGMGPGGLGRGAAAAIIDLPDGRRRFNAEANIRPGPGGTVQLRLTSPDETLQVRLTCRVAQLIDEPGTDRSTVRHLREV